MQATPTQSASVNTASTKTAPDQTTTAVRLDPRTPEEKKRVFKKELLFQLPVLLLAVATGAAWRSATTDGVETLTGILQYILPLFVLGLLLAAYGFAALLTKRWWIFLVSGTVTAAILVAWLGFSLGMFIAALVLLGAWVIGFVRVRRYMAAFIRIHPWRTLRKSLPSIAAAILLLTAVRVYHLSLPIVQSGKLELPPSLVLQILEPLEGTLVNVVPGFSLKGNFGDLYGKVVISQIDQQLAGMKGEIPAELGDLQKITQQAGIPSVDTTDELRRALKRPEVQDQILRQISATDGTSAITDTLSKQFKVSLSPSESVVSAITKIANSELNRIAGPYALFLPWILAILYFFGINALALPTIWSAYLLVMILLRLLERTKLFDVVLVKEPVERVTLLT